MTDKTDELIELKAEVYDLLVELELHQFAIKELQKKVQEVNADIAKRKKELGKVVEE